MLASFFMIKPFGNIALLGRGSIILIFELIWLWYGKRKYVKHPLHLYKKTKSKFCVLFFIFILPSMLMAYILFNQGIIQSLISYRNLLLFLAIPAFLKIEFSDKDIIRACTYFIVSSFIVSLIRTSGINSIFTYTVGFEESLNSRKFEDAILIGGLCGVEILLIPLYYYCQKIYKNFSYPILLKIILLYIILFLAENRSTLFPASIVVAFTFLQSDIRPKTIKYIIILLITIAALFIFKENFISLIEETDVQVNSTWDPRVVAMAYFFDFSRMSIGEILFGTGNISFTTSNYVKYLQESSIHYSDVGFVGFWSQYGIMPIILFSYYLIKAIFTYSIPPYVKITAVHILICSVTISYFDDPIHMMWFILFYYLYCYYKYGNGNIRHKRCHTSCHSNSCI